MAIRTVNPTEAYDKGRFVNAMKDYNELEALLMGASRPEGNWNLNIRKKLGELLNDDERFYAGQTPDAVTNDAHARLSENTDRIADYSKNKFNYFLINLDDKHLNSLMYSIHLAKTGDKDLDELADSIIEVKTIEKAEREGNVNAYVARKMQNAEKWRQEAYFGYSENIAGYNLATFKSYERAAKVKLSKLISKDGKLDKSKLYRLVKENYNKIVADKGVDSDEAKEYRVLVAKHVYSKETEEAEDREEVRDAA